MRTALLYGQNAAVFWWEGSLADCEEDVAVPITHWMPLPDRQEVE